MATFIISPLNSLEFKEVNNLLPNYANTLLCDVAFDGVVKSEYKQKFSQSQTIITQMFTDFDTRVATLVDSLGNQTNLPVTLIKQATDEVTGEIQSYYEFSVAGQSEGVYYVTVKGTKSGEPNVYFQSENFEIVEGLKGYRRGTDEVFEYEYIPNHLLIESSNTENQFDLYYGSDRLSGDPFESAIWIPAVDYKVQPGGESEVYDNLGNLAKLKEISQRVFELRSSSIPRYLAMKTHELASLDYFRVNNIQYVSEEKGENEYFANYTDGVLTMNLTQAFVVGINSDDQGRAIIDTDMATVEIKKILNASGSQQLVVSGGYSLNQITLVLESGTQADVKIGSTPSGNEIMRTESVTTGTPIKNLARNYVNQADEEAAFTAYIEITGVGASATVYLQTIINKQEI
jgi:hypothetical protein